jgi:hypothetical protein
VGLRRTIEEKDLGTLIERVSLSDLIVSIQKHAIKQMLELKLRLS